MTNFEKWKTGLTPLHIIDKGCEKCPLYWDCEEHWGTSACCQKVRGWANAEADEEETKYIVRCELDVGACMFSSFWNGRRFEKGEENAKVFDRRESAEEELNRFGYSPRDYSILDTTEL